MGVFRALLALLLLLSCNNSNGFTLKPIHIASRVQRSSLLHATADFPPEIASYYTLIKAEVVRVEKQILNIEKSLATSTSSAFNVIMQNKLNGLRIVVQRKRFEIEKMDKGEIDVQQIAIAVANTKVQTAAIIPSLVEPYVEASLAQETVLSPDVEIAVATSAVPPAKIRQVIGAAARSSKTQTAIPDVNPEEGANPRVISQAVVAEEVTPVIEAAASPVIEAAASPVSTEATDEEEEVAEVAEPLKYEPLPSLPKLDSPKVAVTFPSKAATASLDATKASAALTRGSYDYGFSSKSYSSGRPSLPSDTYEVPPSALVLSLQTFFRELLSIFKIDKLIDFAVKPLNSENDEALSKLRQLSLSTDAVLARERARGVAEAPFIIKKPYEIITGIIDSLFADKNPIARFYFLETVARVPYYSYISMIHTYETLGWWRRSTAMKRIHFAQEYNELHHLMIWEALGGDQDWFVRFCAQHSAVFSFYFLVVMWSVSPKWAYNFSELLEGHAVDTYAEFADANRNLLESMAPPAVAKEYYESKDLYIFDEFNNNKRRRPVINTLYDVVCSIRDDEIEHITTAWKCQGYKVVDEEVEDA